MGWLAGRVSHERNVVANIAWDASRNIIPTNYGISFHVVFHLSKREQKQATLRFETKNIRSLFQSARSPRQNIQIYVLKKTE